MADTRGVLTPGAETAWKLMVLVLLIGGAGFEMSRFLAGSEARGAALSVSVPADLGARLDRIEAAQADAVRAAAQLQLDVAVIKSQVQDLRGRR